MNRSIVSPQPERSGRAEEPASRRPVLIIGSPDTLSSFRRSLLIPFIGLSRTRVVLDRARYSTVEADRIEQRVNDLASDCGCPAGALSLFSTAVGVVVWAVVTEARLDWVLGFKAALVLIVGAAVGKLAWLSRNRVVLWRLLSRLETGTEH